MMPNLTCPHCEKGFSVVAKSMILPEQRMTMKWDFKEEGPVSAKTVSGLIASTSKLLIMVAKDHGSDVEVLIEDIKQEPKCLTVEFVILEKKQPKKDPTP